MAYVWQHWLADEFRSAGLKVVEVDGWRTRGRPASTGSFEPNGLIVDHHTGTTSTPSNPAPSLNTLIQGRSDLPGPLCQYGIAYDGTVYVIAAGRANVNGKARASGTFPAGDGNRYMGVEVMTDGRQSLPAAQLTAIAASNAVVLRHFGRGVDYLHRHEDISLTGKWDIGQLTTAEARAITQPFLSGTAGPITEDVLSMVTQAQWDALTLDVHNLKAYLFAGGNAVTNKVGDPRSVFGRVLDTQLALTAALPVLLNAAKQTDDVDEAALATDLAPLLVAAIGPQLADAIVVEGGLSAEDAEAAAERAVRKVLASVGTGAQLPDEEPAEPAPFA